MLFNRVLTSVIAIPLLLLAMWVGGWWWQILVALIVLFGLKEYTGLLVAKGLESPRYLIVILGTLYILLLNFGINPAVMFLVLCIVLVFWALFKTASFESLVMNIFGFLYVALAFSYLVYLREAPQGFLLVVAAFLITCMTDTFAYFVGIGLGKHKLIPAISPNKTWEGSIGGLLGCLVVLLIYNQLLLHWPFWPTLIVVVVGSCLAQMGDLLESALKRWAGVKDAGHIILGHGGILDRFDSMIMVAPLLYYFYNLVIL